MAYPLRVLRVRALRPNERTPAVGRDDPGAPVQELPTTYKPARLYRSSLARHGATESLRPTPSERTILFRIPYFTNALYSTRIVSA